MLSEVKAACDIVSPEFNLLIICLKIQINKKELDLINELFTLPIDWKQVIYLAIGHGVYPLAYQCLRNCKHIALPKEVVCKLQQQCLENTTKTLQMAGELVKVLRSFEEAGIRAVVLKSFPLAVQLYGNMGARPSRDIDIFVWPEDVDKARKIIEAHGYKREYPSFKAIPMWPQKWMQGNHHFVYRHGKKQVCIELHWKMGHPGMEIPLDYIKSSLMPVNIGGQPIYTLKNEELILFLMLHGASHGWFRLKWLCDLGRMFQREDFSWERVYMLATQWGVKPILNQSILLARDILSAPVPDYITEMAAKDRKARKLAVMSVSFIFDTSLRRINCNNYMPSFYQQKKYEFFLQCGWKKRLAYIHSQLLPSDRDIQKIPLPDCMYFIYFLIRPCTWLTRQVLALSGK